MIPQKKKVILTPKELQLKYKLSNLTNEQLNLIDEYCTNNMKKLKNLSYKVFKILNIPLS